MSLAQSLEGLRKIDLADLDLNNLGSWPAPVKVAAAVLLFALTLFLGYQFHLKELQGRLDHQRNEEIELKGKFSNKAFQAASLDAYRAQLVQMEESFGVMLRQLPSDTEVPGLL
ncbi:MAG TPA: type 4a pilus biogenesis protein PilO, partial [Pseudomonas sp.]|nr:type 4a pilus biogenesis protein PilO [Pseudomonas sp.]